MACSTARPVPGISSWSTTTAPGSTASTAAATWSRSWRTTATTCAASSACAVRSTWATIGDPASGCRSFGVADFMRVPWPAASTMMASFWSMLRHQDSNLVLTAPKAVVLPLHHGGPRGTRDPERPPVCQTRRARAWRSTSSHVTYWSRIMVGDG